MRLTHQELRDSVAEDVTDNTRRFLLADACEEAGQRIEAKFWRWTAENSKWPLRWITQKDENMPWRKEGKAFWGFGHEGQLNDEHLLSSIPLTKNNVAEQWHWSFYETSAMDCYAAWFRSRFSGIMEVGDLISLLSKFPSKARVVTRMCSNYADMSIPYVLKVAYNPTNDYYSDAAEEGEEETEGYQQMEVVYFPGN